MQTKKTPYLPIFKAFIILYVFLFGIIKLKLFKEKIIKIRKTEIQNKDEIQVYDEELVYSI